MGRLWSGALLGLALSAGIACAQEVRPYGGLRAGEDAYQLADEQRRQRLDDQLYLNDALRARSGWTPARGSILWYGNAGAAYGPPLGIDYAYAYSSEHLPGRRGRTLYLERYVWPPRSAFEPWPYVPGDIYGYSFPLTIRQPIGRREIQTGPNRWESHPVYPEDLDSAAPADPIAEPAPAAAPATKPRGKDPHRRAF